MSVLSSQWLQRLSHSGFLDMQGSLAGNRLPLYLQLSFSSAIRLSSVGDFITLHVVDAVAQTLSKRPHMFSVGFSWGFNTFTSDGRNIAPSASFSPSTRICLSHPWPAQMLCIAQLICLETSTLAVCALWAQADAVAQKHLSSKFERFWCLVINFK